MITRLQIVLFVALFHTTSLLHAEPALEKSSIPSASDATATTVNSLPSVDLASQSHLSGSVPASGNYIDAHLIPGHKNTPPTYPFAAVSGWKDGWVVVNYCVRTDGSVSEAFIDRSSGAPEFEKTTLAAVKNYQYSPATLDGIPVEQCGLNLLISFVMPGLEPGARESFIQIWRRARSAIDAKKLDDAASTIDQLRPWNSYENAQRAILRMRLANAQGSGDDALRYLKEALFVDDSHAPAGGLLAKKLVLELRHVQFSSEGSLVRYADALDTYMSLAAKHAETVSETTAYQKILALVNGETAIATKGKVEQRTNSENGSPIWEVGLLRREFGFSDLVGKLDRFELRCTHKRFIATMDATTNWKVPLSWGRCDLFVFGSAGSTLRLVEYPTAPAPKDQDLAL